MLPAFAGFLQMLGKVGGEKGAGTGLANLFAGLAGGLTGLVGALGRYIGADQPDVHGHGHRSCAP